MLCPIAVIMAGFFPPPKNDLAVFAGEWRSGLLPIPGIRDGCRQHTLEIGVKSNSDAVVLSWRDWCGQTSFNSGVHFTGRLLGVEEKEKTRVLVFADAKADEYRIEFELSGNELKLNGMIQEVKLAGDWKRMSPKNQHEQRR